VIPKNARLNMVYADKICSGYNFIRIKTGVELHRKKNLYIYSVLTKYPVARIHQNFIPYRIGLYNNFRYCNLTLENLFNIPSDPITEVHINLEHLQILGKSLKELNNLADRIAEHKRTTIWMERFMCYLHITGYIAWF